MTDARIIEGGEEAKQKLLTRLRKLFTGSDAPSGEVEIVLKQCAKMGELEIQSFNYEDGPLDEIVAEIIDAAEEDAAEHARGKVKYAMRIPSLGDRTVFTLNIPDNEDDEDDYEDIDELPNRRGLISQQMRHNEIILKEAVGTGKADRGLLYGMIKDLQAENALLKKQWFEGQAIIENLRNMQFARDLEIEKLRKAEARKDQVAGMLLQTGPMLAAKLAGVNIPSLGGGGPPAEQQQHAEANHPYRASDPSGADQLTPFEQETEALFATFEANPEGLRQMAATGLLSQDQIARISSLAMKIQHRKEREQARQQQQSGYRPPQPPPKPYTPYNGAGAPNGM